MYFTGGVCVCHARQVGVYQRQQLQQLHAAGRTEHRTRGGGGDRGEEASVRHLGQHRKRRKSHGLHWSAQPHTGQSSSVLGLTALGEENRGPGDSPKVLLKRKGMLPTFCLLNAAQFQSLDLLNQLIVYQKLQVIGFLYTSKPNLKISP